MDTKEILLALADLFGGLKDGTVDPGDLDTLILPLIAALKDKIATMIDEPSEQRKLADAEQLLRSVVRFMP